jgi:hypothetical protein
MNGIEFNENNEFHIKSRKYLSHYDGTKMGRFLIDKGIVKNNKQAQYLLLGVSVFLLLGALWLINTQYINDNTETYYYDESGRQYTTVEKLEAIKAGIKNDRDFR